MKDLQAIKILGPQVLQNQVYLETWRVNGTIFKVKS